MRERDLAIAWIALAVVFLLGLAWELSSWRSLSTRGSEAAAELKRLTSEISQRQQEIVKEMRANTGLLQEMSWTAAGADPAAFIRRLADLAQGTNLRVLAIGSLDRQTTPQFTKSWHSVEIAGPYKELKALAGRVESERGVLENMSLAETSREAREARMSQEPRRLVPGQTETEVQAKFRITSVELTPAAKTILERAAAASGLPTAAPVMSAVGLPVPTTGAGATTERDPFVFGVAPTSPKPIASSPKGDLELQGIVGFPGGYLAIVDNTIVKVGDKVKGHRVEDITDRVVLLRQPNGAPRRLTLPDIAVPAAPATGRPQGPTETQPPVQQPPGPPSKGPRR